MPGGVALGRADIGEFRYDRAPLLGPAAEFPFGVGDGFVASGDAAEPSGPALHHAGVLAGDLAFGVPRGAEYVLQGVGALAEQLPGGDRTCLGLGRGGPGGGHLLAQLVEDLLGSVSAVVVGWASARRGRLAWSVQAARSWSSAWASRPGLAAERWLAAVAEGSA